MTNRYTERYIRKLFDLFDTNRDGHLAVPEIARKTSDRPSSLSRDIEFV